MLLFVLFMGLLFEKFGCTRILCHFDLVLSIRLARYHLSLALAV